MSTKSVLDLARAQGVMIATAESCTGGLLSGALTEIAGSSDVFERGFVTYSNAAKAELLDVPMGLIDTHGAVSEEVARAMAKGALRLSNAQLAVSVTGIAGPGGSDHKPEGMVCFGLAFGSAIYSDTQQFGPLGRAQVRATSVNHALSLLEQALRESLNF